VTKRAPKVSIGLPVYNGEAFVGAAIESILGQEFSDFELIISDNASGDATREICLGYAAIDGRIRLHCSDVNRGASWNYNNVVALATGEFFRWHAHDDLCLPGLLGRCVQEFTNAPSSVVLVYPKAEMVDDRGEVLPQYVTERVDVRQEKPHQRLAHVLRNLNYVCSQFGLIRFEALRKTRGIGPFIASDWVLLAELAMLGEIWEIPEVLFLRRMHAGMSTYANPKPEELTHWYDTTKSTYGHWVSPMFLLGREYIRSIERMPLGNGERARCYLTATIVWYERQFRTMGGRYKKLLVDKLKRRRERDSAATL